jgi:integrase
MSNSLPRGIKQLDDGRYRVRVSVAPGSTTMVTRLYSSRHEALLAQSRGITARDRREDVAAAMDTNKASKSGTATASTPPPPPTGTVAPGANVRTFAELVETYLDKRKRLSETSSHTLRKGRKGPRSLRPTTYRSDAQRVTTRLVPVFGTMPLNEITLDKVTEWLEQLGAEGINPGTATGYLNALRFVVRSAMPHEHPAEYPWRDAFPVAPATRLKRPSDPSRWGGKPTDANPVLPFADLKKLALAAHAADRAVFYSEALGGPRIGEIFGLTLGDLSYSEGYLWARIDKQVTPEDKAVPWVKSNSSYRSIPLAGILAEYLDQYCLRYHEYDLHNPDPTRAHHRVVVNSAGRDHDGSRLPSLRSGFSVRLVHLREEEDLGLGHDDIGYAIDSHHLRKSCSTYLLHAEEIVHRISSSDCGPEPDRSDLEAYAAWLELRVSHLEPRRLGYSQMHVSAYLGHDYDGKRDTSPASPVTLRHYNLSTQSTEPFRAIADVLDFVARHEVGTLLDEPDEWDLLPVHFPGDPDWLTTPEACALIGITQSNVSVAVRKGRLDGHLAWVADGGHTRRTEGHRAPPALPQLIISRKSAETLASVRRKPLVKQAARRLGVSSECVLRNFCETGRLPIDDTFPNRFYVEAEDLDQLEREIHDGVMDALRTTGPCMIRRLALAFNSRHGDLFVEGRALERWVENWVETLVAQKRAVKLRNGTYAVAEFKTNDVRQPQT